jgi:hypothetical protein
MTKRWGLPDYPGKGGGRGHSTNWFYGGAECLCEEAHNRQCRLYEFVLTRVYFSIGPISFDETALRAADAETKVHAER